MFEFVLNNFFNIGNCTILTGYSKDGSLYQGYISNGINKIKVAFSLSSEVSKNIELKLIEGNITKEDIGTTFKVSLLN